MTAGLVAFLIAALMLTGLPCCGGHPEDSRNASRPEATIRIGIMPEQNVFAQKDRYKSLAEYIGRKLGIHIQLVLLPDYGHVIGNFRREKLDGAFFGSFAAAMAQMSLKVVPLARPEWKDGSSTYYGMIFVRKDSGIRNGADMRGKRFAFVDVATTAGFLLPLHYFQEQGIMDYRSWFSETYLAGTYEDSIYDVLNGRADVGAAKNTVFYRLAETDPRLLAELEILATSPVVPANALAMRPDIDPRYLNGIRYCLLAMNKEPGGKEVLDRFGALRFVETTVDDYYPVFDFANHIGINLASYRYNNH